MLVFFLYGKIAVKPKYNSTATLYLLRQGGEDYVYTSSDYSLALNLVLDREPERDAYSGGEREGGCA